MRMAPTPNNTHNDSKNIQEEMSTGPGIVMINEDDLDEFSSGDENLDNDADNEHNGYKLLQQDENGGVPYNESESDAGADSDDDDEVICKPEEGLAQQEVLNSEIGTNLNIDIDYQHLTCPGLNDELPSTGLGFPENIPEDGENDIGPRDDNIVMNEDKVELVKNAMASFSLPQTNIPDWAKNLSDDNWKESLQKSVHENVPNK